MNPSFLFIVSSNPDFFSLCIFSLCILLLGLSVGSAIKIFLPRKKSSGNSVIVRDSNAASTSGTSRTSEISGTFTSSHAFSAMCIFLALAAILYTLLIFLSHNLFPLPELHKNGELQSFPKSFYNIVFCIIFAWGILLAVFWKIMVPLSAVVYISFAIFTNCLLYKTFGEQRQNIPVKIEENSPEIKVTVYMLPDIVLLPVKRNWFLVDSDFHEKTSPFLNNPAANFYLSECLLSRLPSQFVIPPPEGQAYPSLYSLRITFSKDFPKCELVREL